MEDTRCESCRFDGPTFWKACCTRKIKQQPRTCYMVMQMRLCNYRIVKSNCLQRGETVSCGCKQRENNSALVLSGTKHGFSHRERLYGVWKGMHQRCNDKHYSDYQNYGGRGIRICVAWNNYSVFRDWALSSGYDPNAMYGECTLDRINPDENYCPTNCRWADARTQRINQRRCRRDLL